MTLDETEEPDDAVGRNGQLENLTLWQRVHEHLRQEILDNRLPPGSELNEVALSRSLGVSRGPVREALGRLASEGLVTVRPRRGAVVTALSAQEFLAAYQLREALETLAVRLAVPRLGPGDLDRLQTLVDEMVALADGPEVDANVDAFFRANAAFHATFVEASENALLQEAMNRLLGQMGRYRMRSLALRGSLRRSTAEHKAILRAVRAGDADKAARLLGEHIRIPQRRLEAGPDEEVVLRNAG
jgi:DNA-binding GntR family transcriptional regulator